jgi:hypothetical protein
MAVFYITSSVYAEIEEINPAYYKRPYPDLLVVFDKIQRRKNKIIPIKTTTYRKPNWHSTKKEAITHVNKLIQKTIDIQNRHIHEANKKIEQLSSLRLRYNEHS